MGFELRHLRNFVVVAEELHFGRAARRLAMSQPPLSVSIQQLEEAVGTRLLDRDSKGVRLTAAGTAFLNEARAVLARAELAGELAREVGSGAIGRLRVGFVGTLLYSGLPQWLDVFEARHPRIRVTLIELNSGEQIQALERGELDLGFILARRVPATLEIRPLIEEPFVCCLPSAHRLASRRSVPLSMLEHEPFVLFSPRASPDYHARIIDLCRGAGFMPRVQHELRHWLSVVALVSRGRGVSIVPAPLQRAGMDGVCFRPLTGGSATSAFSCVWPAGTDLPARNLFLATLGAVGPAGGAAVDDDGDDGEDGDEGDGDDGDDGDEGDGDGDGDGSDG